MWVRTVPGSKLESRKEGLGGLVRVKKETRSVNFRPLEQVARSGIAGMCGEDRREKSIPGDHYS